MPAKAHATPNPNALKFVVDRALGDARRSYSVAPDSAADPLAARLFAIRGVTGVLIQPTWVTVNKSPDSSWDTIRPLVLQVLGDA